MLHDQSFRTPRIVLLILLELTKCLPANTLPGTAPASSRHNVTATPRSLSTLFGCTLWFTGPNTDIPVITSGYASIPPASKGGPISTIPCGKFLSSMVNDLKADGVGATTTSPSKPQNNSLTLKSHESSPQSISGCAPSWSNAVNVTSTISSPYQGPRPTFHGPDLSGCLAMTGGSTTFTVASGYEIPNPRDPLETGVGSMATTNQTVSMGCSDFNSLIQPPASLLVSFQRSPVCTSYIQWFKKNPSAPESVFPPGVFNHRGFGDFNCSGECELVIQSLSVLYFSTTSYHGCPASGQVNSAYTPATKYAVVDGNTLTYPSMYLAIKGPLTVQDQNGPVGKVYTNPTIAIPPGGLSSLSFSDSINGDPGQGARTVPYDPGLPKSCQSYQFENRATGVTSYTNSDCNWVTSTVLGVALGSNQYFLAPPSQLLDFDPAWRSCTWATGGEQHAWTYGVIDPPRLLEPEAAMMGPPSPPTTDPGPAATSSQAAAPGASSFPEQPKATANPGAGSGIDATRPSSANTHEISASIVTIGSGFGNPLVTPSAGGFVQSNQEAPWSALGSGEQAPTDSNPSQDISQDDPAFITTSGEAKSGSQQYNLYDLQATTINLASAFLQSTPTNQNTFVPSIGNIVYNAFNPARSSSPSSDEAQNSPAVVAAPPSTILTIANQPITINSNIQNLPIDSTTLTPGGVGITLSGTPVTLDKSYNLIIGTQNARPAALSGIAPAFAEVMSAPTNNPLPVAGGGHPAAADPSAGVAPAFAGLVSVPAQTSEAYNSFATAKPATATSLIIAGEAITPDPAGFVVGEISVSPGAAPVTISGEQVSLASGGMIVVGSSTATLMSLASAAVSESPSGSGTGTTFGTPITSSSGNVTASINASGVSSSATTSESVDSVPSASSSASASPKTHTGQAVAGKEVGTYLRGVTVIQILTLVIWGA